MNTLYIYGGSEDISLEGNSNIYTYCLSGGSVISNKAVSLNDGKRFNDIALEQRDLYSEFIYSLNKHFIYNNIIHDGKISCYFFTDLANKRTENFDTYPAICHITLIKEKIERLKIDKIHMISCSNYMNSALASVFKEIAFTAENINNIDQSYLHYILSQIKFFSTTLIKCVILIILNFQKSENKKIKNLFLTRYPLHFDNNFKEEKYGDCVKDNDYFLISIITDGWHQNTSVIEFINYTNKLKNRSNIILLERFLNISDILKGFYDLFLLELKKKKLNKRKYHFLKIDITDFILHEIQISFNRLPRLFMYHNAIRKVFKQNTIDNFYYYLHEYSYGRYFTYMLKNYFPLVNTIGFQHGPASKRRLLYYLAKNEPSIKNSDYIVQLPMPNEVLAEDEISMSVYKKAGYKNVRLMSEIYRLKYLKNIKRVQVEPNTILIACGLHDGMEMLNCIINDIKENNDTCYLLKPHPRSGLATSGIPDKYNFPNLNIVSGHISEYLAIASEVIVTYSSVGYEAYLLGIPVSVICLPNKINESPLLDIYENEKPDLISIDWN